MMRISLRHLLVFASSLFILTLLFFFHNNQHHCQVKTPLEKTYNTSTLNHQELKEIVAMKTTPLQVEVEKTERLLETSEAPPSHLLAGSGDLEEISCFLNR